MKIEIKNMIVGRILSVVVNDCICVVRVIHLFISNASVNGCISVVRVMWCFREKSTVSGENVVSWHEKGKFSLKNISFSIFWNEFPWPYESNKIKTRIKKYQFFFYSSSKLPIYRGLKTQILLWGRAEVKMSDFEHPVLVSSLAFFAYLCIITRGLQTNMK